VTGEGTGGRVAARSPFRLLRPVALAAGAYALAALVWLTFGDALPGGRWFAVHLFTLGILTNLVVALSEHFASTLLNVGASSHRTARFVLLNVGALALLGFPPALRYPMAAGATILAAAVAWLAVDLDRMRRAARTSRFRFVVRTYEHACAAFLVGAALGAMLGLGLLPGMWYGAGRLAHLHVNILGWGGLTLLATLVFFGPAMMRTQMVPGADRHGDRALLAAAGGLAVAVVGLLLSGLDVLALWPRLVAAAGLAVFAAGATLVCATVLRAGRRARPSVHAWMIQASCAWFLVVVWADALAVGSGRLRLLDALGAVLIVAVLGQAIIATLNYLTPMMWAEGARERGAARERLERLGWLRVALLNGGVLAVGVAGLAGRGAGIWGAAAARSGWVLVGLAVAGQLVLSGREVLPALARLRRAGVG
jgi:hypothetical protein